MINPRIRKRDRRQVYDVRLRDPDGKVYGRTFENKAAARAWEAAEKTARNLGAWVDPRHASLTFAEVASRWLDSNPAKRAGTIERDEAIVRVHLLPPFGRRPIGAVTQPDVQAVVTRWAKSAAPRTVRRQYGTLRAIFAYAVNADWLSRSPCRNVNLPEAAPVSRTLPDVDQLAALSDELGDHAPMLWLGVLLGLRWGEVAGLRLARLDLLRHELTIAEQLTRERTLGEPKSDAGRRVLTMPAELVEMLSAHLARRGLTAADGDAFVFVNRDGAPLDYAHWRQRTWVPACERAGVGGLGFHDLRRANATGMVADRVDLKTAQTRLGHSDPRLTLAVYAQATAAGDRDAADRLAERFLPARAMDARWNGAPSRKTRREGGI